jgi:hypothetical protein
MQLAKQRHHELMTEARQYRIPKDPEADADGSQRLLAVKSVFAGILAAVTSVTKPKTVTHQPATTAV